MEKCKLVSVETITRNRGSANEIVVKVGDVERRGLLALNCKAPTTGSKLVTDGAFIYHNGIAISRLYPETPIS